MKPDARCATHSNEAAVALCPRCGRFLCGQCTVVAFEELYCEACAKVVSQPVPGWIKAAALLPIALFVLPFAGWRLGIEPWMVLPVWFLGLLFCVGWAVKLMTVLKAPEPPRGVKRWAALSFVFTGLTLLLFVAFVLFTVSLVMKGSQP